MFRKGDAATAARLPPSASKAELLSPVTREVVRDARRALTDFDAQPTHSVRVLHALPRTASEAELVHPGIGRYFPPSYWSNIADRLAATGATVSTPDPANFGDAAHQLTRVADLAAPSELLMILGHVDAKGMMKLADGSSLSVAELTKNTRARVVCLGCNTLNHLDAADLSDQNGDTVVGTGSYVGYDEAVQMVARIASKAGAMRR
jgi:hypothetical protein